MGRTCAALDAAGQEHNAGGFDRAPRDRGVECADRRSSVHESDPRRCNCNRAVHWRSRSEEPGLSIDDRAAIARRLLELRIEHRDLDEVIARLDAASDMDDLQLRRLKKRKLRIKDQMNQLEHALIPDQPA